MKILGFVCLICMLQAQPVEEKNLFRATPDQPYHLSIGAVLFNEQGRIACHHFEEIYGFKDVYILMHETMEAGETPLMTLSRGLKEEFGATAEPVAFLGSMSGHLPNPKFHFDKTVLYFACRVTSFDPKLRDLEDPEASSTIEWLDPEELISIMERQGIQCKIDLADESVMIKRAIPNVTKNLDLGPSQSPGDGRSQLVRISNTDDAEIVPTAGAFASARNQIFSHVRYKEVSLGISR